MLKLLLLLLWFPYTIVGTVTYVSDGDTIHVVKEDGEKVKVRVSGIDCPESTQSFGLEAKEFVINEIRNKEVQLYVTDIDRYGRSIALVKYGDKDLSEELLKNGFAWVYRAYNLDPEQISMEDEARAERRGLWGGNNPVAPWVYRKK